MKYMLMMHAPRGKGDWAVLDWPPEDFKAHINFMKRFGKELKDAGELVGAEGLATPEPVSYTQHRSQETAAKRVILQEHE
jgi:hypothetical protein